MRGQVYDCHITGRNYLLCQADNPRCSDRRSIEVRRIETRGNHYADEEVLFPGFESVSVTIRDMNSSAYRYEFV